MTDILIAVVLLALGVFLGRRSVPEKREPPQMEEQELQRLQEDRAAFAQLMGYNADRAYGNGGWGNGV